MKAELKMDARIICGQKVQPTENWVRCHLWGGSASFHWICFGEYLRADSEQQVESVVWRASRNANAEGKQAGQYVFTQTAKQASDPITVPAK